MIVNPMNFAETIDNMEKIPVVEKAVLFYGSSTFTNWGHENILVDFGVIDNSPYTIINHGFGGSTADEALYYYNRMVRPYKPSVLLYYEGDNDIAQNYSADEVFYLSKKVFDWARIDFPNIPIIIVSVKHSFSRLMFLDTQKKLNMMFEKYTDSQKNMYYVDTNKVSMGSDGNLRNEVFEDDGLHLNQLGYSELATLIKPILDKIHGLK